MKRAQIVQYLVAVAIMVAAVLQDDQVLAALGAWLSPSAVTLIGAIAAAAARRKAVPDPQAEIPTDRIEVLE